MLIFLLFAGYRAAQVQLELQQGTIYGETNDAVEVYRGVPYAKPPVGDLRWKPTGWLEKLINSTTPV